MAVYYFYHPVGCLHPLKLKKIATPNSYGLRGNAFSKIIMFSINATFVFHHQLLHVCNLAKFRGNFCSFQVTMDGSCFLFPFKTPQNLHRCWKHNWIWPKTSKGKEFWAGKGFLVGWRVRPIYRGFFLAQNAFWKKWDIFLGPVSFEWKRNLENMVFSKTSWNKWIKNNNYGDL